MTFIHPLLLGGLLLVGIPVLIHMVMRQKPKHLLFPAVRFLLQKQQSNRRRLQLRHLLLLALRILLIAAICLALARPRVLNERLNLSADRPVAAVLVFDTSYSMGYVSGGQNRLQLAIQQGLELLKDFPDGSRLAVLDTSEPGGEWLTPLGMGKELARDKINALELHPNSFPVTTSLATAYDLLARLEQDADGSEEPMPRFVYVFSDRTEACWDGRQLENLKRQRDRIPPPEVHAVFVDVGIDSPADVAITDLTLPRQVISPRGRVVIRATVRATGTDIETEAVCEIDGVVVDKRVVRLTAGQSEVVSFERGDFPLGSHQAVVSFKTEDATLGFNDRRYATFEVHPPRRVLTIIDHKAPTDQNWTVALNVRKLPNFQCDEKLVGEIAQLGPADLDNYREITLLGVASPSADLWEKLQRFVKKGGGLAVIPGGQEMNLSAYNNNESAQALLPARLVELLKVPKPAKGQPETVITWNWGKASSHPFLAPFQQWRREADVIFFEPGFATVSRYWKVEPRPGAASEIISYDDKENLPALLERHFEDKSTHGKVLLFTTALDNEHLNTPDPKDRFNDYLETSSFFFALAQKAVGYLTGDAEEATFNYRCGQAVPVRLPGDSRLASYTIVGPGLSAQEAIINRGENESELTVTKAVKEGNYKVIGDGKEIAAFSLNVSPEESLLDRVPHEMIEALFGAEALLPLGAKTNLREALQGHWSQPVEMLPWLMILVLLVLAVENLLANKFYRREPEENEKAAPLQSVEANQ